MSPKRHLKRTEFLMLILPALGLAGWALITSHRTSGKFSIYIDAITFSRYLGPMQQYEILSVDMVVRHKGSEPKWWGQSNFGKLGARLRLLNIRLITHQGVVFKLDKYGGLGGSYYENVQGYREIAQLPLPTGVKATELATLEADIHLLDKGTGTSLYNDHLSTSIRITRDSISGR